jgi:hypothetical protein
MPRKAPAPGPLRRPPPGRLKTKGSSARQAALRASRRALSSRRGAPGLTLLEHLAVRPGTEEAYRDALETFTDFCGQAKRDWSSASDLDDVLTDFLTELYLDGHGYERGARTVTALGHFLARTSSLGDWRLPRSARALKGWRVSSPASQRLPMPRAAAMAIAGFLAFQGFPSMALWIALTFVCYLRPSETMRLRNFHVVAPPSSCSTSASWGLLLHDASEGVPGKTGMLDDSVLIDLDRWILPPLAWVKGRLRPEAPLWSFSMEDIQYQFQRACTHLGLAVISTHLYSLRHGGASHDLLSRRRTPEQVQRRGRWRSEKSLRRYGKETRLLLEMGKVDSSVFDFGERVRNAFHLLYTVAPSEFRRAVGPMPDMMAATSPSS